MAEPLMMKLPAMRIAWPVPFFLAVLGIAGAGCRTRPPAPRGLVMADMVFDATAAQEKRLDELLRDKDSYLGRIFKTARLNVLLPEKKWTGRVKENGVSRQALFFVDDMRGRCRVKNNGEGKIAFAIFNPRGSRLVYSMYLAKHKSEKLVFRKEFASEQAFSGEIPLDDSRSDFDIVLETRGQGLGAWINPQLVGRKDEPRVFVVIVLDSVRSDHTSLYGYPRRTTPALEKLALDARVFRNAYSTTSWTLPAHVSLFSGRDLLGHGVLGPGDRIQESYPLLAEVFQQNGFVTAAFTGGGFVDDRFGFYRGFQVYSNKPGGIFLKDSSERVLKHFRSFAEACWGEDLFVFLHTYQAHAPYKFPGRFKGAINADLRSNLIGPVNFLSSKRSAWFKPIDPAGRQELLDAYDTAIFYADQTLVDGVVGFLKEKKAYEQATIVVASDHGEEFYDHGGWEHGHSLYNELIRIPLLIKYAKNRRRGTDGSLASIADVPRLLLQGSGLRTDPANFPGIADAERRVLPIALPVSPIIKEIPTRVSFVDGRFHFIYNIIDRQALKIFAPPPRDLPVYEFYERRDARETQNLATGRSPALKQFHDRLASYLRQWRRSRGGQQETDENLRRELKALGYLND
jgi:arylsulfatase A-like enzyme